MKMECNGFWLFGRDMRNVDFEGLKEANVTDIYLSFVAWRDSHFNIREFTEKCREYGIRLHIWTQVLYLGGWFNPTTQAGKDRIVAYMNSLDNYLEYDLDGVHLDYIRFPGNAQRHSNSTEIINNILKDIRDKVKGVNKELIISAAVMPEGSINEEYYGQNYKSMGEYVDVLIPMLYTGNYNAGVDWLRRMTKYIVEDTDAEVYAGLQSYNSDNDLRVKDKYAMRVEATESVGKGADGTVLFRYGLIDDNVLEELGKLVDIPEAEPEPEPEPEPENGVPVKTISQVLDGAKRVKEFIERQNRSPETVRLGDMVVSRATMNRMMAAALLEIDSGRRWNILTTNVEPPTSPSGNLTQGVFSDSEYLNITRRVYDFIDNTWRMPNWVTTRLDRASPFNFMDMLSRILTFYLENNRLPNTVRTHRELSPGSSPIGGNYTERLRSAMNFRFNNATELYNRLRSHHPYSFYFNSRYTEAQRFDRISRRLGLNCVDYSLVLYRVLGEMGYQVHAVHGQVLCSSGWIGHVWLEIRGREFSNWIFYDSVTATSNRGALNRLCCSPYRNRTYNPSWFMGLF